MTHDPQKYLTDVAEAMAKFDAALPDIVSVLGADHPAVIGAVEAAEEVKQHLRDMGYQPPSLH